MPRADARRAYLALDPARVAAWRARVRALPASVRVEPLPGELRVVGAPEAEAGRVLNVGIAWRSLVTNVDRSPSYATAEDLGGLLLPLSVPPIARTSARAPNGEERRLPRPAFRFVRLQYDDCAGEIDEVFDRFGVRVHDVGCDLRDDLDDSAHLMAALDVIVSPMISTADIAGATGAVPVLVFAPTLAHARLLGRHVNAAAPLSDGVHMPNFGYGINGRGGVRVFEQRPARSGDWATAFEDIAAKLHAMFREKFS